MKTTKHNITKTAEPIKPGYKKTPVGIIPEDWEVKKIKSVADVIGGGTPSTSEVEYWNGNINWFTPSEIKGKYAFKSERKITAKGLKNSSAKELPVGTILLTTRATIGEASLSTEISTTNQGFQSLVCKNDTNNVFLYELIKFNKNELYRRANGSTFLEISGKEVKKIKLPIPPLPEQEAIADCLSTWDKGIEKLSALIASKKEQKKGLMQGIFSGKLKVENGELVKVEDEKLWLKGWKEVRLGEIIIVQGGYAFKSENFKNEGIPIIRISNLSDQSSQVEFNDIVYYEKISDKQFEINKGDMMIAMSGATTGKTAVYTFNEKAYLNQRVGLFRNKNEKKFCYSLLYSIVKTKYFENEIKKLLTTGAQPNISASDIESISINLPSLEEQTAIAEVLTTADKEIELLEKKLEAFKIQKKGLMQVLLTGEKRLVE